MTRHQSKQRFLYILTLIATLFLGGSMTVFAADPVTEGFDDFKAGWNSNWTAWVVTTPTGWDYVDADRAFTSDRDTYKTKAPSVCVDASNTASYLITPSLVGDFSFFIRNYTKSYQAVITAYACTYKDGNLTLGTQLGTRTLAKTTSGTPTWEQVSFTTQTATRVALLISRAYFDDFTYTPAEEDTGGETPEPEPEPAPVPVMNISTTQVSFGKVTANATQEITISNTGNAELVATISSDNAEFTVSPTELTVSANSSEVFTITYQYNAEAYGGHSATITVTPNVGDDTNIAVSAYVLNPNAWSEDFYDNKLPEGWEAGDNWTFTDGVAHGQYVHYANNYLVTPALVVSGTSDQLSFQGRENGIYPAIKIEKSLNGGDWTACKTISYNDISEEWQTYTIDGLEAGTYQFRFLSDSYDLDNFVGFKLAPTQSVTETWYVAYTFHYYGDNNELESESDVEQMDITFNGNNIAFNFPNPVNGNSMLRGTRNDGNSYVFSNGQYIGLLGSENAYFCGSNGSELTDITFLYDEEKQTFTCNDPILINSSQTAISYWGYFSSVVISKEEITNGIASMRNEDSQTMTKKKGIYDLQGRRMDIEQRTMKNGGALPRGLYIVYGKKVLIR